MKKAEKFIEDYYKVKAKLEEHNMMYKDVKRIVGLSKPKVLYYIAQELKLSGKERTRSKHERHLFSIIDLFGLAIVKELRKLFIQLKVCRLLFRTFQKCLAEDFSHQGSSLIQGLSSSDTMMLWLDAELVKNEVVMVFVGGYRNILHERFMKMEMPGIAIPLNPVYRSIVKKIRRKDFQIKLVKEDSAKKIKVLYCINGREIDIVKRVRKSHVSYILSPH